MKLDISRVDVWAATIEDKPGGLAGKLSTLRDAGANLEFVLARRDSKHVGQGVVFLTPLKGAKQTAAAKAAGFHRTASLHDVRVQGPNKAGVGAKITCALAEAGLNLRGLSAAVIGKKYVLHLALDNEADAKKAVKALKKL
jgi:hypothetical protein